MLFADPSWLVGVLPDGVVCLNGGTEVKIAFEATADERVRVVDLLVAGVDAEALAELTGATARESRALLDRLVAQGVLAEQPSSTTPGTGAPLTEAILAARRGAEAPRLSWTRTEALLLPTGASSRLARRALRGFIAGMQDRSRLAAYAHAATWSRRSVRGDAPDPERLEAALLRARERPGDAVQVLDLEQEDDTAIASPELERLDGERAHRLGPILALQREDLSGPAARELVIWAAQYAEPNLRFPVDPVYRWAHGTSASDAGARLIARAEAVERYAAGELAPVALRRAEKAELTGVIVPSSLYRMSSRQYADHPEMDAYDPAAACLWTSARAPDGSERWVPAEAVLYPFADPARRTRLVFATSSGVAAHTSWDQAAEAAFNELIERDAFMWTWVQRMSRERIQTRSLPAKVTHAIHRLERAGYRVDFINLTLDTRPVILCAVRSRSSLQLGMACTAHAVTAAVRAFEEAAPAAPTRPPESPAAIHPEDVESPTDHERLHQSEEMLEHDAFLFSSHDVVDLREVSEPQDPLDELLAPIGEPLTIDLSSAATRPFRVVRAIVPNLVPISFGYDREPLGMPRLLEPKTTFNGRTLGTFLKLDRAVPILPHPFA